MLFFTVLNHALQVPRLQQEQYGSWRCQLDARTLLDRRRSQSSTLPELPRAQAMAASSVATAVTVHTERSLRTAMVVTVGSPLDQPRPTRLNSWWSQRRRTRRCHSRLTRSHAFQASNQRIILPRWLVAIAQGARFIVTHCPARWPATFY